MGAETFVLIRDVVVGLSALVVAGTAILGLHTWRRELTGKAKFEVARNVILLALRLRVDFDWARNPGGWSWEYADRARRENEASKESQVLWYAKNRRLEPLAKNLQKLQEASWETEVVLGERLSESVSEAVSVYRNSYAELSTAIYSHFEILHGEALGSDVNQRREGQKELRKIIYSAKGDEFSTRIEEATKQLSAALKTYVK